MTEKRLKECVSVLYDMEMNDYYMSKSISELDDRISRLGLGSAITPPKSAQSHSENYRDYTYEVNMSFAKHFRISRVLIAAVLGFLIILNIMIGFEHSINGSGFDIDWSGAYFDWELWTMFDGDFWADFSAVIFSVTGVFALIAVILEYFIYLRDRVRGISDAKQKAKKAAENNVLRKTEHQKAMTQYRQAQLQDEARVQRENDERAVLTEERYLLQQRLNDSRRIKSSFYARSGIAADYCYPLAIAFMKEYIRLGICTHLEGTDGLYFLLRRENQIYELKGLLTDISGQLSTLLSNQQAFYTTVAYEIEGLNSRVEHMINQTVQQAVYFAENNRALSLRLDQIVENSSVAAYNTERIAREAEYRRIMMM